MDRLKRLVQAADDFQQRHRWLAFPVAVVKKYGEDQGGHRAALLAYYGFFSLFPLLLVAVTLLAAELNVVRTRRLWPRSLAPPPLGGPDERALEGLARQEERLPDQRVEVSFGDGEADAGAEEAAGERPAERGPPAQTR
jgi:hypothetical protein